MAELEARENQQPCYHCKVYDEEENLVDAIHNGASIRAHQKCIDDIDEAEDED